MTNVEGGSRKKRLRGYRRVPGDRERKGLEKFRWEREFGMGLKPLFGPKRRNGQRGWSSGRGREMKRTDLP